MNANKIKVVAFDWDGTLSDNLPLSFAVVSEQIQKGGGKVPILPEWLESYEPPHMEYLKKCGSTICEEHAWGVWSLLAQQYTVSLHLGVVELLSYLYELEIPMYIISANRKERITPVLQANDCSKFFSSVYGHCEHKDLVIPELMKEHDVSNPADILYVGDMRSDMHASRRAKVTGVGIGSARGHEEVHMRILKEAGADHCFSSISEFHKALLQATV